MAGGILPSTPAMGETAAVRLWDPMGKGFIPCMSLLVEDFWSVMGAQVTVPCAMDCWDLPPEDVPHQKDSVAHA